MNKIQTELLSLLKRCADILDQNNINYWLAFGTVLGAERHKGFIPWDDDIDIYIDGKDYEKLQKIFSNGPLNNLMLHDFTTVKDYPYVFPKIIDINTELKEKRFENSNYIGGIYIDVFPLFSISDFQFPRFCGNLRRYFNYSIVQSNYYRTTKGDRLLVQSFSKVLKYFDVNKAQKRLCKIYAKGIGSKTFVTDPTQFFDFALHPKSFFDGYDTVSFECNDFKAPKNHNKYLENEYGDYMKLPDEEKRISNHSFVYLKFADGEVFKP